MNRYFSSAKCKIYRTELTPRKLDFIRKAKLNLVNSQTNRTWSCTALIYPPQPLPANREGQGNVANFIRIISIQIKENAIAKNLANH